VGRNETATAESSDTGESPALSHSLSCTKAALPLVLSVILNLLSVALSLILNLLSLSTSHWRQARRRCQHPAHGTTDGTHGWDSGRRVC
jgi:hypothetical protein